MKIIEADQEMNEGKITNKIYHGCALLKQRKMLIDFKNGKKCLILTSQPFWKEPANYCHMQRRSSTKKRQFIKGRFEIIKLQIKLNLLNKIKQ